VIEHTSLRQPIYNRDRHLIGVRLDRDFALRCEAVTVDDSRVKRCLDFAWSVTKPRTWKKDTIPSNLFWWGRGTMLPSALQHYDDAGRCLILMARSIDHYNEDEPAVSYDFHQAINHHLDNEANTWLLALFDRWVKCMMAEIGFVREPG
jgi:hypothetical protein